MKLPYFVSSYLVSWESFSRGGHAKRSARGRSGFFALARSVRLSKTDFARNSPRATLPASRRPHGLGELGFAGNPHLAIQVANMRFHRVVRNVEFGRHFGAGFPFKQQDEYRLLAPRELVFPSRTRAALFDRFLALAVGFEEFPQIANRCKLCFFGALPRPCKLPACGKRNNAEQGRVESRRRIPPQLRRRKTSDERKGECDSPVERHLNARPRWLFRKRCSGDGCAAQCEHDGSARYDNCNCSSLRHPNHARSHLIDSANNTTMASIIRQDGDRGEKNHRCSRRAQNDRFNLDRGGFVRQSTT